MNRSRTYRWARRAVWGTVAVLLTIGCSPLQTIAFLTHKDVKVPAAYPLVYKEGTNKNKEEVVVALFVTQGSGQSLEFAGADSALANEIAKRLPEMAKEAKQEQKIAVLPTTKVNKFKMQNPNWKVMHPVERGKQLGADFVLVLHLERMTMFKPGTRNEFYEGRGDVTVDVYDVAEGAGEPQTYSHGFSHPKTGFRDASAMPVSAFRREFLEALSVELCRYHVEHKPSSGIAEGH
jgi:hypothetical protein